MGPIDYIFNVIVSHIFLETIFLGNSMPFKNDLKTYHYIL